jgi:hypothetical protein
MSSGQVAGLIDDLPSCAELIARIMAEAEQCLARLGRLGPPGAGSPGPRPVSPRGRTPAPLSARPASTAS